MTPQLRNLLSARLVVYHRWTRADLRSCRWTATPAGGRLVCEARVYGRAPVRFRVTRECDRVTA